MKRTIVQHRPRTLPSVETRLLPLACTHRNPVQLSAVRQSRCQSSSTGGSSMGKSSTAATLQMDLGRHFYLNKVLEQYAAKPATRTTLRQLVFFGRTLGRDRDKILRSANYVRQELAVRIAHRIRDLQALPFVVMTNQHLKEVYEKYWTAFETFRKIPMIRTLEDNENFCSTLKRLLDDHLTIIPSLTIGIVESSPHLNSEQLDGFMERMLRSRISRRVLAEQHIALSEALDDPFHFFNEGPSNSDPADNEGEHVGIIYTNLKVSGVIEKVVRLLTRLFEAEVKSGLRVGDAAQIPEVIIDGALEARFAYIPEHLEYIFFELLKNSMMAVMRQPLSARDPVTIRATIVEGPPQEDLIVRVSDCGGGLTDVIGRMSSHPRREHRRRHHNLHRSTPRRRREALEDGLVSEAPRDSSNSNASVMMDSTLNDPNSASLASTLGDADNAREIDIAMSRPLSPTHNSGRDKLPAPGAASAHKAGASDPLVAAVTSFSNVRRRLEIEDEELKRSSGRASPSHESSGSDTDNLQISAESPGREKEALGLGLQAGVGLRESGIDSRAKMEQLRLVGRFKGTVAEQLASHNSAHTATSNNREAATAGADVAEEESDVAAAASHLHGDMQSTVARQETGLGLPMTKIYTDFFGGSLSLRSLDGHGMDVYVRLPKLGTNKEAIEEIVL